MPVRRGPNPPTKTTELALPGIPDGAIAPHSRKSHTISDSVQAVVTARAAQMVHSSQSLPMVPFTKLMALRAMIAITAAPIL